MDNMIKNTALGVELLRRMKRIRLTEETIAARYCEWKIRCPTHLCTGQEAVAAAVGLALRTNDFVISTHRSHGHYLGKGGDLERMIAEIYGKETGCSSGKGGSMHLIDLDVGFKGSTAIVGGTIPVGVGLGLSIKLHGTDQVSCVFFGDGSTEEGVFYESLNFAVLKRLPVLFICENNLYSVYSPLSVRQPAGRKIYEVAAAIGCMAAHGEGNDALEVYKLVSDAIKDLRNGNGPRFFEFATYRWREHCGPNFDNDIGYRTEDEFLSWKERDPIRSLERSLLSQSEITSLYVKEMEASLQKEVDEAFEYAEKSPFPAEEKTFTDLFQE
jgi:TPP-dependent pyruvate/acetoin dehydrogenase alpha subunit